MDINAYISSGIIEQYALGSTTKEESSILECVMKHNSEVEEAVLEAQETLGDLAMVQSVKPPLELKAKIYGKLQYNRAENDLIADKTVIPRNKPINDVELKTTNSKFWMIAASILLLVSLGWNVLNTTSKNTEIEGLAAKNNLLKSQIDAVQQQNNLIINADKIKLLGVETHLELYATILYSPEHKVYLKLDNLPEPPAGKEYQLWAIVDGKPVDLGMSNLTNSDGLQTMKSVQNPQAFAITLEDIGGSPTPTMEQMYVMGKVG